MVFMSIFEVLRIKQEIKESQEQFVKYSIRSPEDAHQLAARRDYKTVIGSSYLFSSSRIYEQ